MYSARGGSGAPLAAWLPIRYPLTETRAWQRSGHSAATMSADRAPQSKPARMARWMPSTSIRSMTSTAKAACWPLRIVSSDRKRVVP